MAMPIYRGHVNCQNKAQNMMMKIEVIIVEIWSRFHSITIFFIYLSFLLFYPKLVGGHYYFLMEKSRDKFEEGKIVMTFVLAVYEKKIKLF